MILFLSIFLVVDILKYFRFKSLQYETAGIILRLENIKVNFKINFKITNQI